MIVEKLSPTEAKYVAKATNDETCNKCTMFVGPDKCTLVRGDISPRGHCEHFEGKPMTDVQKAAKTEDFGFFLPIEKVDKVSRTVSGYASTPRLDLDGEVISLDAVKKALPGYWQWRNIREMHRPSAVGVAKEANIDTKGLWLTAKIVDDKAWEKVDEGVYKGFSIGGRKLAKSGNTVTECEIIEISIVDRPCNPDCKFDVSKAAKDGVEAYLTKLPRRDPKDKAISQMAKAVQTLAKVGNPPAARDGFSLPAKVEKAEEKPVLCKEHGVENCEKCMAKRDVSTEERKELADKGKALPGGGFPIENKEDLNNARQAIGRAKDPGAAKALIRRRAKELGVKLPDKWSKKLAKRLIKKAENKSAKASSFDLVKSAPSFLTLKADDGARAVEGTVSGHEHSQLSVADPADLELQKGGLLEISTVADGDFLTLAKGRKSMTEKKVASAATGDALTKAIMALVKGASEPTVSGHLAAAHDNMKKAKAMRKDAMSAIKSAHAMHKAAYLAKTAMAKNGKKPPVDDNDEDDFDHQKAMEKLQKAYSALENIKTFSKAADMHLQKAASRVGQVGEGPGDSMAGVYEVPAGVKDMSTADLATAGPGAGERGSEPPIQSIDTNWANKLAKAGKLDANTIALLERAIRAEAKAEVLEKLPSAPVHGNRKPFAFDMSKFGKPGNGGNHEAEIMFKNVNPADLQSDDEATRKSAVGVAIGNRILGNCGRSVFDASFHGTVGA